MLTFTEESHEYQWDGNVVPSVTQVLEDVGIIDFSRVPKETREPALMRGRIVHAATQFDDEAFIGVGTPLDESTVTDENMGYVRAWRRFRSEKKFRPELIEYQQYNQQRGYAGTLDRTGFFEDAPQQKYIIDLKTGSAEWWVRIQLSAYAAFFDHPRTFKRLCIELHADGTWKPYLFDERSWQGDFNRFLYCLDIRNAKIQRSMAA